MKKLLGKSDLRKAADARVTDEMIDAGVTALLSSGIGLTPLPFNRVLVKEIFVVMAMLELKDGADKAKTRKVPRN